MVNILGEFDISNGSFVRSRANVLKALRLQPAITQALERAGYGALVDSVISAYDDLAVLTEEVFKEAGIPFEYTAFDVEMIEAIKTIDLDGFAQIGDEAISAIRDSIIDVVTNEQSSADLARTIRDNVSQTLKRHSNTYARTSLYNYMQTVTNIKAEDAGITKFRYTGELQGNSRNFCQRMVGRVLTKEEIDAIQPASQSDGSPHLPNVFVNRGGWNCQHVWDPVTDG